MADQEINEAVARKLGWVPHVCDDPNHIGHAILSADKPKDYCHSIEAAWEILEKLDGSFSVGTNIKGFYCQMQTGDHKYGAEARADTAPMAICLAFLKLTLKHSPFVTT